MRVFKCFSLTFHLEVDEEEEDEQKGSQDVLHICIYYLYMQMCITVKRSTNSRRLDSLGVYKKKISASSPPPKEVGGRHQSFA